MTALGVVANFIFNHKLPLLIDNLLSTLGKKVNTILSILNLKIAHLHQQLRLPKHPPIFEWFSNLKAIVGVKICGTKQNM